ncbi:MAG TPA: DUF1203 domain-containing protein [Acidimicrobiales bacterium]
MTELHVAAIDPDRLSTIRRNGHDESGNALFPFPAEGWEPLRCCLALAEVDASIVLISYAPFIVGSPWAETGPIFIHTDGCPGYGDSDRLPEKLRTGPRVLKTYRADGSLDYADITVVAEGQDIEATLLDLLGRPAVATVHVRALAAQCFTYAVTRR